MAASLSARKWSNAELRRVAPLLRGSVVNVSGSDDRDKEGSHYRDHFSSASSYTITNFAGHKGATGNAGEVSLDLSEPVPPELTSGFDVVFNHTTLEHIFEARRAFAHLCDLSSDVVVVVVPFAQVTHWTESYGDFWRFTPMGLRALYEENGLEVLYESAGPPRHEPIYLFFIGSRQPERWRHVMPTGSLEAPIGSWIGYHPWLDRIKDRTLQMIPNRLRIASARRDHV